jgi:hypothetical protein
MTATRGAEQRQGGLWGSPRWASEMDQARPPAAHQLGAVVAAVETSGFYVP